MSINWDSFHALAENKFIFNYIKAIAKIQDQKVKADAESALDVLRAIYTFRRIDDTEEVIKTLGVSEKDKPYLEKLWTDFEKMSSEDMHFLFTAMVQDIEAATGI